MVPVIPDLFRLVAVLVTLITQSSDCRVVDNQHLADVTRDQNHVEVREAAQLEESLAPFVPFLQLYVVEQLIVDTDQRI